ncbi:MAG: hypothetical protein RR894_09090 [Terrisporobacter sp.]
MIIKLGRERFWAKFSNIERWPEILKSLPKEIPSKSRNTIAKDYLHYTVDDKHRILNADEVYGIFGAEISKRSINIAGCNLIKKCNSGYKLSDEAIELVERYNNDEQWEIALASQVLKYSIRVRSIAIALLNGGYIQFKNKFMENLKEAYISYDKKIYYVFSDKTDEVNINTLIKDNSSDVLGPFWKEELDIIDDEEIVFSGATKGNPSLSFMTTYLQIPLHLFSYLEWFKEVEENKYILDKSKIKENIENEVIDSLIIGSGLDELDILKELIDEYKDSRGYIPVAIVGEKLKDKIGEEQDISIDDWVDRYFITKVNNEIIKIVDNEQGQPRHGRGLLGKKDHQLLKIEFIN